MKNIAFLFFILVFGLSACGKTEEPEPIDVDEQLLMRPPHFPNFPNVPYNPMRKEAIVLGRKLFYDPILSGNNMVSCQSCHRQELAFSDGLAVTNKGVSGSFLHRNSSQLINLAWATNGLFWDGGATNLESLTIGPITHLDEMGQNVLEIPDELARNNYNALFEAAFPDEKNTGITTQKVLKAIAQFLRTLNSANAKYDQYILKKTTFSQAELDGMAIFDAKCGSCHDRKQHLFTDNLFHNNGKDSTFSTAFERTAQGRYRITFKDEDMGSFKTPTLRNWAYTAPYMHDGRFKTMNDVLNHYANGIKNTPSLDNALRNFTLSNTEKQAILTFLNTLNDEEFTKKRVFQP